MNNDLMRNRIKVLPEYPVIQEWETLQWTEDEDMREKGARQDNDEGNASLHAYRHFKHFRAEAPTAPILANTQG